MTTVTRDNDSQNIYTVPVGRCNQQISFEDYKYEDKRKNALIVPVESISNKEPMCQTANTQNTTNHWQE